MLKFLWVALVVIILDQVSKQLAEYYLVYSVPIPVIPFFNWTLSYNAGAAFSFLNDAGGWQRWFFIVLALVVSVAIVMWIKKLTSQDKWVAIALSLVLGGAIGNVIDRFLYGHVIDFLHVYYGQWSWPIFNIADSAISIGVAILLWDGFFGGKEKED
ncbi:MAG: lipoprotein signal peptidase [Gammaproteobacteria bacterium]|nr:lipoprotein signal peptidase [Gammaproteobacteria bacterium]